ncbi:MAG: carboxymuconolactone decarboxylase family protein [Candidatus Methylomirabilia bacterium]
MAKNTQALIKRMKQARGYLYPEWELAAEMDPDFFEAYDRLYREALAKSDGLPIKYRELVALGILAFRGVSADALMNHIRRAYRHGATRKELLGALQATMVPGGAVTFLNGLRALARVERDGKGGTEAKRRAPARLGSQ